MQSKFKRAVESLAVGVVALVAGLIIGAGGLYVGLQMFGLDEQEAMTGMQNNGPPPASVHIAQINADMLRNRFRVVGRLREVQRAVISSEVQGRILAVPVEEGDVVIAGQTVLAHVDDVWAKNDLMAAEADVAAAQAQLTQSELNQSLLEELLAVQSAQRREVDEARARTAADKARLDAAEARRQRAQEAMDRVTIYAPFDGVIVQKHTEVGQWVASGEPIVTIISKGEVDAIVSVPEAVINEVSIGESIDIFVEPLEQTFTGRVVQITPLGDNPARTFPVDVRMNDEDGRLKSGMSVVGYIPIGQEKNLLVVPRDAVLTRLGQSTVWVAMASDDGEMHQAVALPVRVLFGVDQQAVAVRPMRSAMGYELEPGMKVVIEGGERLFPMQPLVLLNDEQTAADSREP